MQARDTIERVDHSLELEEKLDHQIKGWKVQRICGVLLLILIVFTALGLFGSGILSEREVKKNNMVVQYERFLRYENETTIGWLVRGQDRINFLIPQQYLNKFKVEKIVPDNYETILADGYIGYTFKVSTGETAIRFYLTPKKAGTMVDVWKVNGQSFEIAHFIYP
ncbi:hypothetical protein SAMN05421747_10983 [Parapedobacter composti]|uniref:Uncharacterized protein n=1 Tax=Parapedobacter composti TaxID=623281 RepID=A0A1I1IIA3_9SPHI|nr:hypothetical protein [Parapedobacter composti]SFC35915.1 hypothetical protein SAMN05421747_10983 [Parapedobacter composti]